jgi:cytochrome c oxidase assembly protein subunit 15
MVPQAVGGGSAQGRLYTRHVNVQSTALGRLRSLEVAPTRFFRLASLSVASLFLIVATGAAVRLTASGLGCDAWPGCEHRSFFPENNLHGTIEFGNRVVGIIPITFSLVCWLAARRTPALPRWSVRLALAVAVGTLVQAPLGLITIVSGLNPLLVMSHFLLALVVLGGAIVVAIEGRAAEAGRAATRAPAELRRLGLVLAASCLALLVTGAFVTAAGPHPGDRADIRRLFTLTATIWVHVRVTAVFGCVFLVILGYLTARREQAPALFRAALALLGVLIAQMTVGEIQYETALPWWLVLVHVVLATSVWALTAAFVTLLWRPLRPFGWTRA